MRLQIKNIVTEEVINKRIEKMKREGWLNTEKIEEIEAKLLDEQAIVTIVEDEGKMYEEYKLIKKYGYVVTIPIILNQLNKIDYIKSITDLEESLFTVKLDEKQIKIIGTKIQSRKDLGILETSFYIETDGEKHQFYIDHIFGQWYKVRVRNPKNIEKEVMKEIVEKLKEIVK